jgi:Predicted integral membrane protein
MRTLVLLLSTITAGIMAGVFFTYTNSVLPGLHRSEDRSFVDAMQRMNVAIQNGWFLLCFLGTLVLAVIALVLHLGRAPLPWIAVGAGLYAVTLLITFAVSIPLNNALDAAGPPASIADFGVVRAAFERPWVPWNLVRTFTSLGAFASLAWALVKV